MSGRETLAQARGAEDAVGAAAMKKAIWRLGPFLGLLYLVAYIDRNNAGFAKLEMTAALQITEAAFGFAAGIFFIGYLLFEVPSNLLLEKFGARKWIARIMISWGIVAALTAFVQDATQFAIARFILGIAEAGFFPGVLLYLTLWFPRQYRTQVLAVFVLSNPIANAVAAPLSGWMLELHGLWGLDGWQLVFLLQGIPAVLLAFVVFFWLPDRPQDARWLTPAEQRWITDTLAAETQATEQRHGRLRLGEVFRNGRLWTLIVLFFGVVFGAYGLGMWLPTIVKSMGDFSNATTGWLVALPNLCAALVMLPWERAARKQGNIPLQIGITLSITALSLIGGRGPGHAGARARSAVRRDVGALLDHPAVLEPAAHGAHRHGGRGRPRVHQLGRQPRRLRGTLRDRLDQRDHGLGGVGPAPHLGAHAARGDDRLRAQPPRGLHDGARARRRGVQRPTVTGPGRRS
ncbi:MFS transporter [Microbacterium sp. str. 'China']|uniref:MFS transporter n=1 Tax=Microbacterium sp. str. 'China' TaxID=2103230 RepID=UPI001F385B48|nr:MFS transporter [Microbacterium sp. str. 'China']